MIPRLLDRRAAGGLIEVVEDGQRLAYAVPANAGGHWAVYRLLGDGKWSLPKVVADEDLALADLEGFLAWAVAS